MTDASTAVDEPSSEAAQRLVWTCRRFRAPRTHGGLLVEPPLTSAVAIATQNHRRLELAEVAFCGRPLAELRRSARAECLDAASTFVREFDLSLPDVGAGPWFVTGHQPQLYHPGVWVKNFAASALAGAAGGVGLNLIVDNDVVTTFAVRVPSGDRDAPSAALIPYDAPRSMQTWETAGIQDRGLFDTFAERTASAMKPWGVTPMAVDFWPLVQEASRRCTHLAKLLSAGRAQWERRWGAGNFELPISRMCRTRSFAVFVCDLLLNLPRFHHLHNAILGEYRQINRVRSRTHPVPDLRISSAGLEAPFWVWRTGDTARGRLFIKHTAETIVLSRESDELAVIPAAGDPAAALAALSELTSKGLELRPRALTTTLFARLLLADLFMHGIGGAKYDETTDQLLQRFYKFQPPEFLTLSSTLHLPLGPQAVTEADRCRLQRQLRDVRYHPVESVSEIQANAAAVPLLAERSRWLLEQQAVSTARRQHRHDVTSAGAERFHRLHELTARLADLAGDLRQQLQRELAQTQRRLRANRVLEDRDYAFCLFPEDLLHDAIRHWCAPAG